MQIRLTDYNCNITIINNNNCYLIFENLFHFKAHLGFFFPSNCLQQPQKALKLTYREFQIAVVIS